jgi:hypothetical protein
MLVTAEPATRDAVSAVRMGWTHTLFLERAEVERSGLSGFLKHDSVLASRRNARQKAPSVGVTPSSGLGFEIR